MGNDEQSTGKNLLGLSHILKACADLACAKYTISPVD